MNNKSLKFLFFSLVVVTFLLNACFESAEKELTETQVPTAILDAFNAAYPHAIVREYSEEVEDGQKIYEISFRKNGRKMDVVYSRDGRIIEIAHPIAWEDLPSTIRNELNKKFNKYEIIEAERTTKDTDILYEVELRVKLEGENQKYEILFSEDGRVIKEEKEEDDGDDDR